jgi:hypothetical protein
MNSRLSRSLALYWFKKKPRHDKRVRGNRLRTKIYLVIDVNEFVIDIRSLNKHGCKKTNRKKRPSKRCFENTWRGFGACDDI